MDPGGACSSSASLDKMRNAAMSRRGGVRVRGGRLPPIRIRDVAPSASAKKVVAPKIPQRRIKIKQETLESSEATPAFLKNEQRDFRKPFGRGRGQRVYIQTEGSFLEQGPALRLKKESVEPHYERIPRSSFRMKTEVGGKINISQINLLLEGYDEKDAYLDYENDMQPVRLPHIKMEFKPSIKEEVLSDDDTKTIIKKEPEETGEIQKNVPDTEVKIAKKETPEPKIISLLEAMKLSQEEDMFVLFQLPSCFPFKTYDEDMDTQKKSAISSTGQGEKVENSLDEAKGPSLKDVPEGPIGKLRVMKSGRMRLLLGPVDVEIESGVNAGSTAEVVSIPLANGGGGDFVVLGKIYQKMIMHPILFDSGKELKNDDACE